MLFFGTVSLLLLRRGRGRGRHEPSRGAARSTLLLPLPLLPPLGGQQHLKIRDLRGKAAGGRSHELADGSRRVALQYFLQVLVLRFLLFTNYFKRGIYIVKTFA